MDNNKELIARARREGAPEAWPLGVHYKPLLLHLANELEAAEKSLNNTRELASIYGKAWDAAEEKNDAEWEYRGIPIYETGEEAAGRSIQDCLDWIRSDADPKHWINDPRNDDLARVVSYRTERRRKAGEWERVEEEGPDLT